MGLLGNRTGAGPAKQPADDVLLLHAILCMISADGVTDDAELEMIRNYANTLPEFRGMDGAAFDLVVEQANAITDKYDGDLMASLQVLAVIQSEAVRKKAFVLAVDVAMSSGDVHDKEEVMLEAMQRILRIDDPLAHLIVEIIGLKYIQ